MNNYKVDEIAYLVTSSNLHSVPGMQASSVSSDQEVGSLQSNVSAFSQYVYRVEEYLKKCLQYLIVFFKKASKGIQFLAHFCNPLIQ